MCNIYNIVPLKIYDMAFKMKGPTFFNNTPLKQVDLKKKTGLGPRTNEAMGEQFPQGNDKFLEDQEDLRRKSSNNEYQKNFKGNEKGGSSEELKAFQADLKEALANGDTEAARRIRMDIASSKKANQ